MTRQFTQPPQSARHILLLLDSLELGGSERQALVLAKLLSQAGCRVQVWAFGQAGPVQSLAAQQGISCTALESPWQPARWPARLRQLLAFARRVRHQRFDAIFAYTMAPNVIGAFTWRLTGARRFFWGQRDLGITRRRPLVERCAVRLVREFLANSTATKEFLVQELGVAADRIRVIRNAIELPPPAADRTGWRTRLSVDESCVVACMIANVHPNKDHAALLHAWRSVIQHLHSEHRSGLLVLAGRLDSGSESVRQLAADLRLTDSVRFLGPVTDISGLLAAADLGVFSSRSEGSPNGVLECMAMGLPVAATDIPAIREAVGTDGFPFLAAPGNAEALATCILALAIDPNQRRLLGETNHRRIREWFSSERLRREVASLLSLEPGLSSEYAP